MQRINLAIVLVFILYLYYVPLVSYSQQKTNETGSSAENPDSIALNSIVTGVSAVGGAIAGGLFTYYAAMKIEDRKDKEETADFDRYRMGLIRSIGAELNDYKEFVEKNIVPELVDTGDPIWFYVERRNTNFVKSRIGERPEYRIFGNTAFEQLIRTIEPELLVRILSAYKTYNQLIDMAAAQIKAREEPVFPLGHRNPDRQSLGIPKESIKYFIDTANDITNSVSKIK